MPRPSLHELGLAITTALFGLVLFLCLAAAGATGFTNLSLLILSGIAALLWLALAAVYLAVSPTAWLAYSTAAFAALTVVLAGWLQLTEVTIPVQKLEIR